MRLVLTEHELVTSELVLAEVDRILTMKLGVPPSITKEAVDLLRGQTLAPTATAESSPVRDPDDALVLASAIAGKANVLVTGDRDLLDVANQVQAITITDPRGFWEMHRR